jgi:cytidine deaminase
VSALPFLLDNGQIVLGSNENAAYPSGLCAERVAIFCSGAIYPEARILKWQLQQHQTTIKQKSYPTLGACRQSIAEYETKQDFL